MACKPYKLDTTKPPKEPSMAQIWLGLLLPAAFLLLLGIHAGLVTYAYSLFPTTMIGREGLLQMRHYLGSRIFAAVLMDGIVPAAVIAAHFLLQKWKAITLLSHPFWTVLGFLIADMLLMEMVMPVSPLSTQMRVCDKYGMIGLYQAVGQDLREEPTARYQKTQIQAKGVQTGTVYIGRPAHRYPLYEYTLQTGSGSPICQLSEQDFQGLNVQLQSAETHTVLCYPHSGMLYEIQ